MPRMKISVSKSSLRFFPRSAGAIVSACLSFSTRSLNLRSAVPTNTASDLARGDLSVARSGVRGSDELGRLETFDDMANNMRKDFKA